MTGLNHEIKRFSDIEALSHAAAALVLDVTTGCVHEGRQASVVLAGGTTPLTMYRILVAEPYRDLIPWKDVHLFWGDERFVPADSPMSNYRLARDYLIDMVPIPRVNVHPIPTSLPAPDDAAAAYEHDLREFFPDDSSIPHFDLTILGFGADGHTASLFPGDPILEETKRWVQAVNAPPGIIPKSRITLTLPALNGSRIVLVTGAQPGKENVISKIEHGNADCSGLPVLMVSPRESIRYYIADSL